MQVKAEPGTYIEMPKMFEKEVYFLELKRNLYGQIEEFFMSIYAMDWNNKD